MVTKGRGAPGDLERIRELLNSWLIPNDVRVPVDRFEEFARKRHLRDGREASEVRALRDDLRRHVEAGSIALSSLNRWVARLKVHPVLVDGSAFVEFEHEGGAAGELLSIVLRAIQAGSWVRLKACPDCRWVFFDHSRNGTKRWCLMNAGSATGRACGTIDKVRRFRERQRSDPRRKPG
jgi:predicted RNA-binding Zn ribbon-like protein